MKSKRTEMFDCGLLQLIQIGSGERALHECVLTWTSFRYECGLWPIPEQARNGWIWRKFANAAHATVDCKWPALMNR